MSICGFDLENSCLSHGKLLKYRMLSCWHTIKFFDLCIILRIQQIEINCNTRCSEKLLLCIRKNNVVYTTF